MSNFKDVHYLPANPGFYVVEVSDDEPPEAVLVPIIGWQVQPIVVVRDRDEADAVIYPVTILEGNRRDNPYILQPNGTIGDYDRSWDNMEDFMATVRQQDAEDKAMGTITIPVP